MGLDLTLTVSTPSLPGSPQRGEMFIANAVFMASLRRSEMFLLRSYGAQKQSDPGAINIWLLRSLASDELADISTSRNTLKLTFLLGSLDVAPFGGVDAEAIAFVDERRHLNRHAVFQGCGLVDVGNCRALHRRLGLLNGEFHRGR
jgi:hypothetical protein